MPRRPDDPVSLVLRIRERLRTRIEHAAKAHQTSINNEIRVRLEKSFEAEATHTLDEIAIDMARGWERYGERFLRLRLEDDLIAAMTKSTDPEVAKAAQVLILTEEGLDRRRMRRGQ